MNKPLLRQEPRFLVGQSEIFPSNKPGAFTLVTGDPNTQTYVQLGEAREWYEPIEDEL